MARKTKYTPALVKQLLELLRKGNSDADSCARVGISTETFYQWIKNKPEFSDSVAYARTATRLLAVKAPWKAGA